MNIPFLLILASAFVLGNIHWFSDKLLYFISVNQQFTWLWRLVNWLLGFAVWLAIGWFMEQQITQAVYDQDWEFYASLLFFFCVLSSPGMFVMMYRRRFRKRRRNA